MLKQHQDPYGTALGRVTACTLPVYLSISRPLRLPDLGDWERDDVVGNLPDEFTVAECVKARSHAQLRDLIKSHGYDGIVYTNEREAAGAHAFRLAINQKCSTFLRRFPQADCSKLTRAQECSAEYDAYLQAIAARRTHIQAVAEDS